MNGANFDWSVALADPALARVGVYVTFKPRQSAMTLRSECLTFIGDSQRVIAIGGVCDPRYPGEVALFHVEPGRLLFGCSWVASGDVEVLLAQTRALERGGAHA